MSLTVKPDTDLESDISNSSNNDKQPRMQLAGLLSNKMYIVAREVYFLALIVLTYAAFQNSTPKISKTPKAYPFFPKGSLVRDYYNGELTEAIELASQSDLAFVMYYAPWDAESQTVRHEFSLLAQHMSDKIHFVAINCWHPTSECRQQYSKVYAWPVLMAYPAHGRGIQYRGIKKHQYMIKFLQLVSQPFQRITNYTEIVNYQVQHDAIVVGSLTATLGSNDFGVFYMSALRLLERDPFREIQFLILTQNSAPKLHLFLWNETLEYPQSNEWKPDVINNWVIEKINQVSLWATLPGSKSTTLNNYLNPGPALILFTPRNPLYSNIDYYNILHTVALDYYNCDNNTNITMQKQYIQQLREHNYREYKNLQKRCIEIKTDFPTVVTYDLNYLNNSCNKKIHPKQNFCYQKNVCGDLKLNLKQHVMYSQYTDDDIKCPKNLQQIQEKDNCYYFNLAKRHSSAIFSCLNKSETNVSGTACKTNTSLAILALDTFEYFHLAENLGIDILKINDKSATVILNPTLETYYVMNKNFSEQNLMEFITNFTDGKLTRKLNSQFKRINTHFYEFKGTNLYNKTSQHVIQITELSSRNFLTTVLQPNTAVIVMYYSTKCSFCMGVSHILIETAKILSVIPELQFYRIDGDNQGLPWEYSMHHFPSILYFPPKRKSETRVFPQSVPLTVPNLLSFILANVDVNMKLKVMWAICNHTKFNLEVNCVKNIRNESMTNIGKLLRMYRLSFDIKFRTLLLKQLQNLRDLYFALSENFVNVKKINKYINLLQTVELTTKNIKYL